MTSPATHAFAFSGQLLQRGFWLYVWQVEPRDGTPIYYVGRTGDSPSLNAQSAFNRMAQHLGSNINNNALRRRLHESGISPEDCEFHLTAHGPILPEEKSHEEHRRARDVVAALEKALAEAMSAAGYDVINRVNCRKPLDDELFATVRAAFAAHFPRLSQKASAGSGSGS